MTKTNEINQKLDNILSILESMDSRITALETSSSKKSVSTPKSTSKKTASSKKSTPKTDTLAQFEPKKGEDGHYNYKSWKTCRAKYVASVTGKKDSWVAYEEFCKIAAPFDARYPYTKKSDR